MGRLVLGILEGCKGIRTENITDHSNAGIDIFILAGQKLEPGKYLRTGVKYYLSDGFELQLRPRSSLYKKFRLIMPLTTLDPSYRGEILCVFDSCDWYVSQQKLIEAGVINGRNIIKQDVSLAQLVVVPFLKHYSILPREPFTIEVKTLPQDKWDNWHKLYPSPRGTNGYGSTGNF